MSSVQEICAFQEFQITRTESKQSQWLKLSAFDILEEHMFAECMAGALQVHSPFQTAQIDNYSIFRILYWNK